MSQHFVVYLKQRDMPSPLAWDSAIAGAGFPAKLYTDFDVQSCSGFPPCSINDEISGFEYYASAVSVEELKQLELAREIDFSILFCAGSRPLEIIAALAASSALAAMSDGTIEDPQVGELIAASNAIAWARSKQARLLAM
ncbi:hypothetical protein [Cupriavidus gilardii]|uniref:hypothetical protein n=1 Tax=Cupriavidus gilardii TaxID=82541 RepID=UPI0012E8AA38|nr:hypothetical protein [Cupriavidus gilardii]